MAGNRDGISASIPDEALAPRVPEDIALVEAFLAALD
jgi:hypothetical protein